MDLSDTYSDRLASKGANAFWLKNLKLLLDIPPGCEYFEEGKTLSIIRGNLA